MNFWIVTVWCGGLINQNVGNKYLKDTPERLNNKNSYLNKQKLYFEYKQIVFRAVNYYLI